MRQLCDPVSTLGVPALHSPPPVVGQVQVTLGGSERRRCLPCPSHPLGSAAL